ncbi:uncharacterized protein LOC143912676 [Arctopsyche grandis]|uniref:uncharacterized protein LOC143912676 n=1 Tax=Arctopsyche grandis TaxID=121162 RepID=UPI00406D9EFC
MLHSPPKSSDISRTTDQSVSHVNVRKRKQPDSDIVSSEYIVSVMDSMKKSLDNINGKLDVLSATIADIKSDISSLHKENNGIKTSLAEMSAKQSETNTTIIEMQRSMELSSDHVNKLQERVVKIEKNLNENDMTDEMSQLKTNLRNLQLEQDQQQQRERMLNLEIGGLPENDSENLMNVLMKISEAAGVNMSPQEVVHIRRVQPRQRVAGRPRVVIAKLNGRIPKDNIIAGIRKRRGISTQDLLIPGNPVPVFVNDHLIQNNKVLLKRCKQFANKNRYKFVWVKNCHIYLRKNEKSPKVMVNSEMDLDKLKHT